ncbi:DUF4129 domain-containing protein [Thalassobacillus sp. CUG 92003]|uniref:DUF4129 domain-containing protein n=1 Tax=Thalassobacillus sp. CUG 92003 TaxID=2736641 RepID=UPI0015E69978|nr:DUF4129 domain-containing protein [Thalassobacillus sp. CUG 92003]
MGILSILFYVTSYWGEQLIAQSRRFYVIDLKVWTQFLIGTLSVSVLLWILFPYIHQVISFVWVGAWRIVIQLMSSILFAFGLTEDDISLNAERDVDLEMPPVHFQPMNQSAEQNATDTTQNAGISTELFWIGGIVLALAVLAVILHNKKIQAGRHVEQAAAKVDAAQAITPPPKQTKRFFNKKYSNDEYVRYQIYQLETMAFRKGVGRHPWESIREWLHRIGVKHDRIDLYEKVRYGGLGLNDEEHQIFKREILKLRAQIENAEGE